MRVRLLRTYREACRNKIDPKVAAFLKKVHHKFLACGNELTMAVWDLLDLGLSYPGYGWDRVRLWSRRPKDDYDFWLYLANAVLEKGENDSQVHGACYGCQPDSKAPRRRPTTGSDRPLDESTQHIP